jgi:hypothetical protein
MTEIQKLCAAESSDERNIDLDARNVALEA